MITSESGGLGRRLICSKGGNDVPMASPGAVPPHRYFVGRSL